MQYPKTMQPTHAKWIQIDDNEVEANKKLLKDHAEDDEDMTSSIFTPVKPIYSRNYMIVDTVYESAPSSSYGVPGPDGDVLDLGFNGLSSVSDEIKSELPPDCLAAFERALEKEMQWKKKWGTESSDCSRRAPAIDKGLIML
jgi:chromatin structure-remodeling complex protein RSC7